MSAAESAEEVPMSNWKTKSASALLITLAASAVASSCGDSAAECGNGTCEAGESPESCARDCTASDCGDGTCAPGECGLCDADCRPDECEVCGNGACLASAEDCKSCSQDCGSCEACGKSGLSAPQPFVAEPTCDFLDPSHCFLPFPSNWFTRIDATTPTGRRVNFPATKMPTNSAGIPISVAEFNRNDGFSPGAVLVVRVPGVSLERSGAPLVTHMQRSLDRDSPLVIIDAETGERHLAWAEYDAQATEPTKQAILIRPGLNFAEGRRYIVALRNLRDTNGGVVEPNDNFRVYRDCVDTSDPVIEARRDEMEDIFSRLAKHGIKRSELYLAWDFTVASPKTLASRLLHMRDTAFADYPGTTPPAFKIDSVEDAPIEAKFIHRVVRGTFTVPSFIALAPVPSAGGRFVLDSTGLPTRQPNDYTATFTCIIPRAAFEGGQAERGIPAVYGHQVLATQNEVLNSNVQKLAHEHNVTLCATDWVGMSEADALSIFSILVDISNFPTLADRVQQAIVNFMLLGRLMKSPTGLVSHPAFRGGASLEPAFENDEVFYLGEGQGGTIGGALLAVSKEIKRAVFNVSGINYTTILTRSQDFAPYQGFVNQFYPDELDRAVLYPMMQMLWDRAEASGYAAHLTANTYDKGTPPKRILIHEAFADHVMPNIATEWFARTIGAKAASPILERGRGYDKVPLYGLEPATLPLEESAIVMWDNGTVPAPPVNVPPSEGIDPHGAPGETPAARRQIAEFWKTGKIIDVCGGQPCRTE